MTTLHWADGRLEIHRVVVGPYENNVFVLRCRETGEAVLIDAANEHEQLLELCQRLGVRRVLETHGHWDHIQAVPAMREAGYEVAVTAADAPRLKEVGYDVFIDDAEVIEVGKLAPRSDPQPRPHGRVGEFQGAGRPPAVQWRHLVPRWAWQHVARRRRLRNDHPLDRHVAVHTPTRDDRHARPRRQHDDRSRATSARHLDRPWLVTLQPSTHPRPPGR